jgi:hypothetical protein
MNPLGAASGRGSGLMPGCSEASSSETTLSETHFERSDLLPRLDVPSGGGVSFEANLSNMDFDWVCLSPHWFRAHLTNEYRLHGMVVLKRLTPRLVLSINMMRVTGYCTA